MAGSINDVVKTAANDTVNGVGVAADATAATAETIWDELKDVGKSGWDDVKYAVGKGKEFVYGGGSEMSKKKSHFNRGMGEIKGMNELEIKGMNELEIKGMNELESSSKLLPTELKGNKAPTKQVNQVKKKNEAPTKQVNQVKKKNEKSLPPSGTPPSKTKTSISHKTDALKTVEAELVETLGISPERAHSAVEKSGRGQIKAAISPTRES